MPRIQKEQVPSQFLPPVVKFSPVDFYNMKVEVRKMREVSDRDVRNRWIIAKGGGVYKIDSFGIKDFFAIYPEYLELAERWSQFTSMSAVEEKKTFNSQGLEEMLVNARKAIVDKVNGVR